MVALGAVGGGAVGQVDRVGGAEGDGGGVFGNRGGVVFAFHGVVAGGFELFGFGVDGGGGGGRSGTAAAAAWGCDWRGRSAALGAGLAIWSGGGGFAFEFLVDAVYAEEGLVAYCLGDGGGVVELDLEGVADAVTGDFNLFYLVF